MNKELKDKFDSVVHLLDKAMQELVLVKESLTAEDDVRTVNRTITDLAWAIENCTVMGLHQIGEALSDTMGCDKYDKGLAWQPTHIMEVQFIKEKNSRAVVRLPNGSKTTVDHSDIKEPPPRTIEEALERSKRWCMTDEEYEELMR